MTAPSPAPGAPTAHSELPLLPALADDRPARPGSTARTRVTRVRFAGDGVPPSVADRPDLLATEEPLEIRVDGRSLAVTMRTPGADFELAVGFLHGEGVLTGRDDLSGVRYCVAAAEQQYNVVTVDLAPGVEADLDGLSRSVLTTSACGVCGTSTLEGLRVRGLRPVGAGPRIEASLLRTLPDRLQAAQSVFDRTGGLHGAGLFTPDGELLVAREDIGRHNAVDKVVGWALLEGRLPLADAVLVVSGRAGFEIVQKAVAAGIGVVAAVSAPSSLAVDTAREFGQTLVGFLRSDRFNVYAGRERVATG